MTRVKICGITNPEDRDRAVAAGADALGFVVDIPVGSPREIPADRAAALIDEVPPFVTTVVVTMPDVPERGAELLDRTGADAIQLHGDLVPDEIATLAGMTDRAVIVAVDADDPRPERFDGVADALLVDSSREAGAGGTGRTHDWAATKKLRETIQPPLVLAGGLTPHNVVGAIDTVGPYAVDVASGVERAGGLKDHDAVRAFVENVRHARAVV